MLLWTSGHLLGFLCMLMMRTPGVHHQAVQNDATESLDAPAIDTVQDGDGVPNNQSVNRARNGGRQRSGDDAPRKGGLTQSQVGCRELRSTKYISDGQCTSINPIKELVCAGECLPSHLLPNWIGTTNGAYGGAPPAGKRWSARDAQEWRCVIDRTRAQRIRLQCQDGSSRTYKITVVTSCKCKRYSRQQNDSSGHKTQGGGGGGGGHGSKDQSRSSKRRNKEQRKAGLPEDWAEEQS